jgi:hypothetical protein
MTVAALVVLLAIGLPGVWPATGPHDAANASEEADREPIIFYRVTACGVERWAVKTGIDSGARLVDTKNVVNTTIFHLRTLTPPAQLPFTMRIRPVEYTVFRVTGYLLRVKQEADSDYHLVLADSGGRTMIAEIPAPQCVGSQSPFLPQIRSVRRVFQSKFHPADFWVLGKWAVQVTGVGFFDFKHGQSGVAPNAIELHPVLGVKFVSGVPVSGPPVHPTPPPSPKSGGSFSLSASVSPNPVRYGQYATLTAHTVQGASCTASVVYSTGRSPVSFNGSAQIVGAGGTVSWSWHMESKGSGGTGTVTCSYRGQSKTAMANFTIG